MAMEGRSDGDEDHQGGGNSGHDDHHNEDPLSALVSYQGVVILDGGMGTQLQAMGVPLDPKLW